MASEKKRSQRLKPVLDLANLKLDKAEVELGRCRQLLAQEQQKLSGLENYQLEYQQMLRDGAGVPVVGHQLQSTQAFLKQLQAAIEQQQSYILSVEQQLQVVTEAWRKRYGEAQAIEKVIDSAKKSERAEIEKKQQNETDDIAQMRFISRGDS